jgi:cell division protein FtsL
MIKIINGILVVLAMICGAVLYAMEHQTRGLERQIAQIERDIAQAAEDHKLLSAEWSSLTRPERIQSLAAKHLKLAPAEATQYTSLANIKAEMELLRAKATPAGESDVIGDLLQRMQ